MKLQDLIENIEEDKVKEVLRPKHVIAHATNQEPPLQDKVNLFAVQIEKWYDYYLNNIRKPNKNMKVAYSQGQIQVVVYAEWEDLHGPLGVPYCAVRADVGEETWAYFPVRIKQQIKQEIMRKYNEVGWHVRIDDDKTVFSHPIDAQNHLSNN